ncbi:hypothetical protein CsatA_003167 [Cannabis sativa]
MRGMVVNKGIPESVWVSSVEAYFQAAALTQTERALSLFELMVAKDPTGHDINALEQHIKNLLCPSTPFFYNTLYDPYREGALKVSTDFWEELGGWLLVHLYLMVHSMMELW